MSGVARVLPSQRTVRRSVLRGVAALLCIAVTLLAPRMSIPFAPFIPGRALAQEGAATPALANAPKLGARILELNFTPASNAQIALWIEDATGTFMSTVALTEAVATRGIGNRPGASQMNSGFRWPYGRREGVLPIWAHRRMTAPGAQPFRRVIFQKRNSEGHASRSLNSDDFSRDDYFCLSFNNSRSKQDALDAVSCASVFNSDKGRYITEADVNAGYAEPYEDVASHVGRMQALSLDSLYPPRRDVRSCAGSAGCNESADVATFDDDVREILPDIDTISMATPQGDQPQQRLFSVPPEWQEGSYRACLEINVEGDYNTAFDAKHFPTPTTPTSSWDTWATTFGYPYRGQPSVVYCVPFALEGSKEESVSSAAPEGTPGSWDTASQTFGALVSMAGMSDDAVTSPGSGADRLHKDGQGARLIVKVKAPLTCENNGMPSAVSDVALSDYPDALRAHEWAELTFNAAGDDIGVFRYDVRVSTEPMVDDASFMRGRPAKNASIAADELRVPTDAKAGVAIEADIGGLIAETHYYVGVRAIDGCAQAGPFSVAEIEMPKRTFATVTPCFVATAAYGTPFAKEITALRRFRDRHLANHVIGRALVAAYGRIGPKLADVIRGHESLRAFSRRVLAPVVAFARLIDAP